jgi:hypothetical protein
MNICIKILFHRNIIFMCATIMKWHVMMGFVCIIFWLSILRLTIVWLKQWSIHLFMTSFYASLIVSVKTIISFTNHNKNLKTSFHLSRIDYYDGLYANHHNKKLKSSFHLSRIDYYDGLYANHHNKKLK